MSGTRRVNPSRHNRQKPKLGQNFLSDPAAIRKIVDALGDVSQRIVIEIGPGRGALTRSLAQRAGRLICIEFDRMLAAQMRMDFSRDKNVEIIEADVLSVDFDTIVQGALRGVTDREPDRETTRARLIGNLPYYITSDILLRLFAFHRDFDEMVIMVQKEVADRLAAEPGTRDFGLLTATAQLYCDVTRLFTLPPGAFTPPPKVHSTVLRLTVAPKLQQLGIEERGFISFLKLAFGQKRKTLVNNLKARSDSARILQALKEEKLLPGVRAEALDVAQLAAVYRRLA